MNRPLKSKKPKSKSALNIIANLERRQGIRELEKRILIVCEDEKSSTIYFKALKKHFKLSGTSVEIEGSGHNSQPIQVVNKAIALKLEASKASSGTEPFGHVWCIIDGDYGVKCHQARTKASAHGIELAISTICFEYWVLLHFEENDTSSNSCDELIRHLKKHLPNYDKGKYDFKSTVVNAALASERAEKLRRPGLLRGDKPEQQNPCTEIYKIINLIKEKQ